MARGRRANPATGAFGGAPYGATKRCTGWVKRMEEGGGGGGEEERKRGPPSLQNEDPTPQDGWEQMGQNGNHCIF
eukprot:4074323-Pyramimonas_sp.AAC.1